jgi:hypothetical protein
MNEWGGTTYSMSLSNLLIGNQLPSGNISFDYFNVGSLTLEESVQFQIECAGIHTDSSGGTSSGGGSSPNITQTTTIQNYDPDMIGCFCQTAYMLNDPEGDSPIVKVVKSTSFDITTCRKIIGIISGPNTVVTHGPVFVRLGESYDGTKHAIGKLVVPTTGGVRGATPDDELIIRNSFMPRVRITDQSFVWGYSSTARVTCFIN